MGRRLQEKEHSIKAQREQVNTDSHSHSHHSLAWLCWERKWGGGSALVQDILYLLHELRLCCIEIWWYCTLHRTYSQPLSGWKPTVCCLKCISYICAFKFKSLNFQFWLIANFHVVPEFWRQLTLLEPLLFQKYASVSVYSAARQTNNVLIKTVRIGVFPSCHELWINNHSQYWPWR